MTDLKITKEERRKILELIRLSPKWDFFTHGFGTTEDFIMIKEFKKLIKKYTEK